MATDTLRGDGLARVHGALAALEEDPQRLDQGRTRFRDSPPPYTSHQSHNSTRSQSPNPPNEEQRRREECLRQLILERRLSLPYYQFGAQRREEEQRLHEGDRNGTRRLPIRTNFYQLARENVKKRWVEQGIWNVKWTATASGAVWKHEQPLELESESESETETEAKKQVPIFSFSQTDPQTKPRQPKSDEEKRWRAERRATRRATREREREASRPFHQFVYQVSKESERIQDELESGEAAAPTDINTIAYENVKNIWIERKIWNSKWGVLPGISWKHEDPLEGELADGPVPIQTDTIRNGNNGEAVEAPLARIFGLSAPAETNQINASQRGQSANTESAGLANGDLEHSTLELNSASRPAVHTSRASRRRPPDKDGQMQEVANTSLGTVRISKVSKAPARKGRGARRRPNASETLPSGDPPLLPGPDVVKPLLQTASIPPRRSKRLQLPEPSMAEGSDSIAPVDLFKGISRTRPKRTAASNPNSTSPAKPQGVSKRQYSQTTRQRTRKGEK